MREYWSSLRGSLNNTKELLTKDYIFISICLVFLLFTQGSWYFNFNAFAIDDLIFYIREESYWSHRNFLKYVSRGRLFFFVSRIFIITGKGTGASVAFLGYFLFILQFVISSIVLLSHPLYNHLKKLDKGIFIFLSILFPIILELVVFKASISFIALSFAIMTAFAAGRYLLSNTIPGTIIGILLTFYTLNVYQPLFILIIAIAVFESYLRYQRSLNIREIVRSYANTAIAFIVYFLLTFKVARYIFLGDFGSGNNLYSFNSNALLKSLMILPKTFYNFFIDNITFYSNPIVGLVIIVMTFSFIFLFYKSLSTISFEIFLVSVLTFLAIVISPFVIGIVLSKTGALTHNPRVYTFTGIILGFLYIVVIASDHLSFLKNPMRILGILLVISFMIINVSVFFSQQMIMTKDFLLGNRIISKIESIEDFETKRIVIVGRNNQNSSKKFKYRFLGRSVFSHGHTRALRFLNYISGYQLKQVRALQERKEISDELLSNPHWPSSQSIFSYKDDYLIVKLNKR